MITSLRKLPLSPPTAADEEENDANSKDKSSSSKADDAT
jgi:hypothetical protein